MLVTWAGMARGSMQRGYYWQGRRRYFAGDTLALDAVDRELDADAPPGQ